MAKKLNLKQRSSVKKQLDSIQQTINKIKETKTKLAGQTALPSAPLGKVAGATTELPAGLNAAQLGGASGVGLETPEDQEIISSQVEATTNAGGSKSQAGDSISSSQAGSLLKSSGLDGLFDSKLLVGKSFGEAAKIVQQEKAKRTGQISANTSFAFTPEILNRTQRAIDKFGFALNEATNTPFEPKEFKAEEAKNLIDITSKEIGGLFDSPEQLYEAYKSNQQFKESFDKFMKKGGTLENVSKNIATAPSTVDNQITNAMVDRGELPESAREIYNQNIQSDSDYLASLTNSKANQVAQKLALEELAPESEIAQAEIARNANIPEELKTLYFGNEKVMGMLQIRQQQSAERIKVIEEQERDDKRTTRQKAELAIDRNRAEVERSKSQIEENRLAAKNYMTAQLAKLGALNTTGAAPLALQTLETKYQGQARELESNFKFAQREIEIGLDESISKIENDTDNMVLKIEEDIAKDGETSIKEVMKARQAADKEIYSITEQYSRRLRERTTNYTEDLKKQAEEYAKKFAKAASNGLDKGFTAAGNPATNSKVVSNFEQQLNNSRGGANKMDNFVNSELYVKLMNDWILKGGTISTFKSKFPPSEYVNPNDYSLPPQLRYATESKTLPRDTGEDDESTEVF